MVKNLFLVRHATAEDPANSSMVKDVDRELIQRGIMEAAKLGNHLFLSKIKIDGIYCSPAKRTLGTAKLIAEQLKIDEELLMIDERLFGGGPRGYLALVKELMESEKNVCIVGHNPDISFFGEYLTRDDMGGEMNPCTLVHLVFENMKWNEISQKSGKVHDRIDVRTLFENE